MTWSAVHTIPYSTAADWHTAFQYLFGTFLPSLPGMATGAHPDASVFKRKFSRTSTNLYTGSNYTEYFWATWVNTTPTALNLYRDGTYTSTPGDLCTDATNLVGASLPTVTGAIRFWKSDVNPRAGLMTKGKAVVWWEPGWTAAAHYDAGTWTGTTATCLRSFIFPFTIAANYGYRCGPPDVNNGTSASEFFWGPSPGIQATAGGYYSQTRIDMNCSFMNYANSGTPSPSSGSELLFVGVGNDIGFYRANPSSSTNRAIASTITGQLALCAGRYYLMGLGSVGSTSLMWDMGTSEPDFS